MVVTSEFGGRTATLTGGASGEIPMSRLAKVEVIAAVAVFAASAACSFPSGFTFEASGGRATY